LTPAEEDLDVRPYAALLAHAERELEHAGRGELDRLQALGEQWDALTRELPPRPPAAATVLLQRAIMIHERTRIELLRLRDSLLGELQTAKRARRAATGYGAQFSPGPSLDRSA